jgi:hypothetical protein
VKVQVRFIDAATDEVIGESEQDAEELPASFEDETIVTIGDQNWMVTGATPRRREDIERTGRLLLRLSALGVASPPDILFTLPTVAADFPPIATRVARDRGAVLLMHEDDWRQIELVSQSLEAIVDTEFESIREVIEHQRVGVGYQRCHARSLITAPIQRHVPPERIRALLADGRELKEGAGVPQTMTVDLISDSFAVELGTISLYVHEREGRVDVLGLQRRTDAVGGHLHDARILCEVLNECRAIIVDWCALRKIPPDVRTVEQFLEAS